VVLAAASAAAQAGELDTWRVRAANDGAAPLAARASALEAALAQEGVAPEQLRAWIEPLRATSLDDQAAKLLAIAAASRAELAELEAELRLDLAQQTLARGDCSQAHALLSALDGKQLGAWRALIELELAQLARLMHEFPEADAHIDRAWSDLSDRDDDYSRALRAHTAGERLMLELELGRIDHAARALTQIEAARSELGTAPDASAFDVPLTIWRASLLVAQDDHRAAIETCNAWLAKRAENPLADNAAALVEYRRDYARLLLASAQRSDVAAAIAALEQRLDSPQLARPERWRGWLEISRAQLRNGDAPAAERSLARADALFAPGTSNCEPSIRRTSLKLALAAARASDIATLDAALAAFEREWRALLASWRAVPRPAGGIGWLHSASSLELLCDYATALVARHGDRRGPELALRALLDSQSVGSLARELGAAQGDLLELRTRLLEDGEHGMVLFVLAPARAIAFAVDRNNVTLHELPGRLALRALVEQLLGEPARVEFAVKACDAFFPAELGAWVKARRRLTLVGVEQLGQAPVELFAPRGGQPLGLTHALDYLPSAPVGLSLAKRVPPSDFRGAALLAVRNPGASVRERFREAQPLEIAPDRLEELLEPWGESAFAAAEGRVELRTYEQQSGRRPFVVQWLTHGVFDPLREPPTGLVLEGEPGVVWSDDLARIAAPPVVLLSCCGGARSQLRRGEDGAQQLAGAFFRAGASAVVATPASTRLSWALDFAQALHRELAAGVSVAEAARRARAELAARTGIDVHAWSAWQVVGLGATRAATSRGSSTTLTVLLLATASVVAALLVLRRARRLAS
jgi:hypothetical protein